MNVHSGIIHHGQTEKTSQGTTERGAPHSDDYFTTLPHGQTLRHAAEREKPGTNDRISHDFLPMKFQNGQIQRQKDDQELPGAGGWVGVGGLAWLINTGFLFRVTILF